ncbi:alpha/beta hydrolase [Roseivirga pacifica]|uniref:alpha/beta hydrolase n=1 Tax=Roseivirga pacifica TaxID=1267423 RepID=UPI003BAF7EF3
MKIYGISGLGADKRVFEFLELNYPLIPIEWIEPEEKESLKEYSFRISKVIDDKADFVLIGVSFGGAVAIEISKILSPKTTILISSLESTKELKPLLRLFIKNRLIKILPEQLFTPPKLLAKFLFDVKNEAVFNAILKDTSPNFAKWAIIELLDWENKEKLDTIYRIHGTKDKLTSWLGKGSGELIKNGGHFMIVDRAKEISNSVNKIVKSLE